MKVILYTLFIQKEPFIDIKDLHYFSNLLATFVHVFVHVRLRKMQIGINQTLRYLYRTFLIIYMLCRQMYTVLCYLTQFLLNVAQHVSSLYKAHLQGLFW
jgi:hypothetical protein